MPSNHGTRIAPNTSKKANMPTYSELIAQANLLIDQAEQVRKQQRDGVIANIQAQLREHGLTVDDLAFATKRPTATKSKAPAKYRGPSGELWAGGPGRKPEWAKVAIAAGELDKYLIA